MTTRESSLHSDRDQAFSRNDNLEGLLRELNGVLGDAESRIGNLPDRPQFPVVFVIGAPRSGTTVMMQWLAAMGCFAYPSNLLSRFYGAPYLGARIQQLLTDRKFNYKDELGDLASYQLPYSSNVGKTQGVLQPNEFWYFWRRFIPNVDPEWITAEQEGQIDVAGFRAGIAAIETAFNKPFATKGIILQYNLACLQRIFDKALFINTVRHPFFNTQSLLNARREYFGDENRWFSVKPKEYPQLMDRDAITQVAGQVHFTQKSISGELAGLPAKHGLTVQHEDFCNNPAAFYARLRGHLAELGYEIPAQYSGPARFEVSDQVKVSPSIRDKILGGLHEHSGQRIEVPS